MNIEEFDNKYVSQKSSEKLNIEKCDHPDCSGLKTPIGKQAARRNILKHGGKQFVCRDCMMKYDNPMNRVGESRQTDEIITVECSDGRHQGSKTRQLKKSCYYGEMKEPYAQICGSCAQLDKKISEEQKKKISEKLTGRELTEEHKNKISDYMKTNVEGIERGKKNLISGYSSGWNKGMVTPDEVKQKISQSNSGKIRTLEQRYHISSGRKQMLDDTGGFTEEHRNNLRKATLEQYKNGFDPQNHHLSGWHYSEKMKREVLFRSSYEKKAYMMLDEDVSVASYASETVKVTYFNPEKQTDCEYLIDLKIIYTDGSVRLVEIKPLKMLEKEVVKAKIAAATKLSEDIGVPFETWGEDKLFNNSEKNMREFVEWLRNKIFLDEI